MLTRILAYALLAVTLFSGVLIAIQHFKISKLEVNVIENENAIQAYEELLKVIPFNRMVEERSDNAEDEINATLNNSNGINDGVYRL